MFPTANSQVYYNEDGEPAGFDTYHDDPPEIFDEDYYDEIDPDDCEHDNVGNIKDVSDDEEEGRCYDCDYIVSRMGGSDIWRA